MQTICKCMLFHGLHSIQIEQAAYFLKAFFLFGAVVAHIGEKLQRISCSFQLVPSLKLTKACTKETGNCCTRFSVPSAFFLQLCPFPKCAHARVHVIQDKLPLPHVIWFTACGHVPAYKSLQTIWKSQSEMNFTLI